MFDTETVSVGRSWYGGFCRRSPLGAYLDYSPVRVGCPGGEPRRPSQGPPIVIVRNKARGAARLPVRLRPAGTGRRGPAAGDVRDPQGDARQPATQESVRAWTSTWRIEAPANEHGPTRPPCQDFEGYEDQW